MCSAFDSENCRREGLEAGITDFLPKPVKKEKFYEFIKPYIKWGLES